MTKVHRQAKRRAYQCPGCWAVGIQSQPGPRAYLECACGEGLTCIDLREAIDDEVAADRIAVLEAALRRFGAHLRECAGEWGPSPCDCGLADILPSMGRPVVASDVDARNAWLAALESGDG